MAAETTLDSPERREIYLDRRIVLITPGRIDIHPARSIVFLPLITLLLGLAIFPLIFFYGDSFSIPVRLLLTYSEPMIFEGTGSEGDEIIEGYGEVTEVTEVKKLDYDR